MILDIINFLFKPKFILFGLYLSIHFPVFSQYTGGDFSYSEDHQNLNEEQLILEIENIVKVVAITGYKNRQVDNLAIEITKSKSEKALEAIKKALKFLPTEYRIVVMGHADKSGVEVTERGNLGNDFYSQKRAEFVYNYLLKNISQVKGRILMGGLGSSSNERMVTFKVLKKEEALKLHEKILKK